MNKIGPIGFYDLEKLRSCTLSGIARHLGFGVELEDEIPTRQVIIGRFYHDLMESGTQDYNLCITTLEKYRKLINDTPNLRSLGDPAHWREINEAANVYLSRGPARVPTVGKGTGNLRKLTSKSGRFVGKPDMLAIDGNSARLSEFKSSRILEDGSPNPKHVRQLLFYSYLIYQNFEVTCVIAKLQGLNNEEIIREILPDEANAFGRECEEIFDIATRAVDKGNTSEFSVAGSHCTECRLRPLCAKFKAIQFHEAQFDGFRCITGNVTQSNNSEGQRNTFSVGNHLLIFPLKLADLALSFSRLVGTTVTVSNCRGNSSPFEATYRSQFVRTNG